MTIRTPECIRDKPVIHDDLKKDDCRFSAAVLYKDRSLEEKLMRTYLEKDTSPVQGLADKAFSGDISAMLSWFTR